jgi:ubiquitin C-terminal hydrolase
MDLFRSLVDGLHEEMNRNLSTIPSYALPNNLEKAQIATEWWNYAVEANDSVITDYFRGQMLQTTSCRRCGNQTFTGDTFLDLPVMIP